MKNTVVYKACPFCGVELLGSLVDAIIDPKQPESCPKQPRYEAPDLSAITPSLTLATYAMLGSMFKASA